MIQAGFVSFATRPIKRSRGFAVGVLRFGLMDLPVVVCDAWLLARRHHLSTPKFKLGSEWQPRQLSRCCHTGIGQTLVCCAINRIVLSQSEYHLWCSLPLRLLTATWLVWRSMLGAAALVQARKLSGALLSCLLPLPRCLLQLRICTSAWQYHPRFIPPPRYALCGLISQCIRVKYNVSYCDTFILIN